MAIVLENKVREVATIQSAIHDSGEITGGFTQQQANDLSLMLRTGSLPASIWTTSRHVPLGRRWAGRASTKAWWRRLRAWPW